MFIFLRTLVTYARTIFMPRCCLNFQSMRTQAEPTLIAHNMFGQIKMEIPWYINRHTFISRKRDGKPSKNDRCVASLLLCVLGSTNSASLQTPLILCFKSAVNSCMVIACPVWTARTYIQLTPTQSLKSAQQLAVQQALERGCKLRSAWTWLFTVCWYYSVLQCHEQRCALFPFPGFLCRCYKSGATTTIISVITRLHTQPSSRTFWLMALIVWFLSNHPCTRPSSWLPEKTPGCQERYWYSLRAPWNRSDAHLFLLVRMHHKILEQFTVFKQPSCFLRNCAGWFTFCKQEWYMDLPGSACAPRFTYILTAFGCHTISSDYQSSRTVWTHSTWTYHGGLERSWHFDTTWSSPFQQIYEDISHTFWCTFGEYSWMVGWRKKNLQACVASLPSLGHSQQPQQRTLFLAFAFLATTFWSKECVMTGIEGLWSSGSVTDVTGTLFRMRNTFCWTVRMNIWSDFAHNNSLSSHLNLRMAQLVWGPLWTNLIFLVLPLL